MNFQRIKHPLSGDYDLLWLLLYRETSYKSSHFLSSLPLCQLAKSLLTSPNTGVDDFKEQLSRLWIEREDSSVDWLGSQVALLCLVNGDSVDVCVIYEPDSLVREELSVVLRVQIGLSWLTGIELEALPDPFSQHVESRVGFHDLVHGLRDEILAAFEPEPVATVQVVS